MDTQDALVAIVPSIATAAAGYAVARAAHRASNRREDAAALSAVEVAEIEAHTADQRILLEWMEISDKRHAIDVDRLYTEMSKVAKLETENALLRAELRGK